MTNREAAFPHTPLMHREHTKTCGCSINRKEDFILCPKCLAAYTADILSFDWFKCYDCSWSFTPYFHIM